MRTVRQLILDAWSALGFKRTLGDGIDLPEGSWLPPSWTGEENQRRLIAYQLLEAYDRQSARRFRTALGLTAGQSDVREYGDPHLLNRTILAAVLGDTQTVTVPGADDETDLGAADGSSGTALAAAQDWYRQWWDDERGPLKMHRCERRAVKLGNGVYVLGWNPDVGRVRLRDYDPGWYFPAWQPDDEEFPSRVHIAWQVEQPGQEPGQVTIRRITWDLRDADDGVPRTYLWNDKPTLKTCYLTDATFTLDVAKRATVDDLTAGSAVYRTDEQGEIRDRDLAVDFVPVVNLTNTIDDGDGWGEPATAAVAQIIDDLSQTDTDIQAAGATAAKPVVFISGATLGDQRMMYAPGEVLEIGDGNATILDTSRSLDALLKQAANLEHRLSVNARVPDAILGRVSPADVPSGIALALSFGPLAAMVGEMRLARDEKYRLLFKFARRLSLAAGAPDVPPNDTPAEMTFGPYLPQDEQAAIERVRALYGGAGERPVVSLETAVATLIEAGLPIEDAEDEARRIRMEDYVNAVQLLAATDKTAVRELLNTGEPPDLSGPPPEPPPTLVPAPGQAPPGRQQPAGQPGGRQQPGAAPTGGVPTA